LASSGSNFLENSTRILRFGVDFRIRSVPNYNAQTNGIKELQCLTDQINGTVVVGNQLKDRWISELDEQASNQLLGNSSGRRV